MDSVKVWKGKAVTNPDVSKWTAKKAQRYNYDLNLDKDKRFKKVKTKQASGSTQEKNKKNAARRQHFLYVYVCVEELSLPLFTETKLFFFTVF